MIDQIDQQWLRSFHCVYENNSFKQAAEYLGMPTSNVSRHVALLEEQLNVRLLNRTTRRVTPTEFGEQLYGSTINLVGALNDAFKEISYHSQAVSGQLKVLMPDIPMLADAAVSFCLQYPEISFLCETSLSPKEDLLDGYDLVVTFNRGKLADSGWVAKEIMRYPSVVVAAPSVIERYGRPHKLAELSQLPCITSLTALNGVPWVFKDSAGQHVHQHVKSSFKVNSGTMARSAALAGIGFSILPQWSCVAEINAGLLKKVELEAQPEDLVLYAFHAGRKHLATKISLFVECLQKALNNS
ncbi:LysR family transcriptional regulator [Photobacterium sanguinicancri]|uniref:LysR family transcriptional regulator n=1 Tax=Photobacterium sanguinicancri TaxID=875932 RepID=A0ABX4FU51_9GAMM|nr:LysR family transcriptional regulator [Photobacterium sanguinicancri]KXI20968.1 LysR family transcriptional regulator [Photobacterium sanguinicancri]OZS42306.1 LysR family transcriptional regulator [Photobacterium sanguinicancri]